MTPQKPHPQTTTTVVSVLRHAVGFPVGVDPALEANTYSVTRNIDMTVVLTDCAVELAAANSTVPQRKIGSVMFPPSSSVRDLKGLIESGVHVVALQESVDMAGLNPNHLIDGINVLPLEEVSQLLSKADHLLTW